MAPDGIERGITSDAYYHVRLEDGRTGYISVLELERFGTDVDPAQPRPNAGGAASRGLA